jgi:hypothetical protein
MNNLSMDNPEKLAQMKDALEAWHTAMGSGIPQPIAPGN